VQCARRNLRDEQLVSAAWSGGDDADKADDGLKRRAAPSTAIITCWYLHGNGSANAPRRPPDIARELYRA
jgi:hypothetical protein